MNDPKRNSQGAATDVDAKRQRVDIEVRGLHKSFGPNHVLRGVDLRVYRGETFAIIGRSGCGKSVLLKHIMGLMQPDKGEVFVLNHGVHELPQRGLLRLRRRIGMVFQLSALLNSLTVRENVILGLAEQGKMSEEQMNEIAREKLALVGMEDTEDLLPEKLSGGMKKRAAVARTLATSPRIILFDEPTAGLDPLMSDNVDELILDLKEKVQVTSVMVTHDMISAFRVADRIGMFHQGTIVEVGTPEEIRSSENPVVQEFIDRQLNWRN